MRQLKLRVGDRLIDSGKEARGKFLLEVDMGDTAFDGKAAGELGRILRYWAGNLHHYDLKPGAGAAVYDSSYREVGRWSIVAASSS